MHYNYETLSRGTPAVFHAMGPGLEESMGIPTAFADIVHDELIMQPGVRRLTSPRRGTVVFSAGTPARELFYIESGMIKLQHPTSDQDVLLGVLGAGELCGEAALIGEAAHNVSATTLTKSVIVAIPADVFQRVCDFRPELWRVVLGTVFEQTAELQRRCGQLCGSTVRNRILSQLETIARKTPAGEPAVIPLSQSELASLIGATRETTSTTLNALAREGAVTLGHRQVLLNANVHAAKTASAGNRTV
jgi:CRP/FNR family transcriptional regulator, cyclic AMP receptor protein